MRVLSPILREACMIFSSQPGATMPGELGCGPSLKRIIMQTFAPSAVR